MPTLSKLATLAKKAMDALTPPSDAPNNLALLNKFLKDAEFTRTKVLADANVLYDIMGQPIPKTAWPEEVAKRVGQLDERIAELKKSIAIVEGTEAPKPGGMKTVVDPEEAEKKRMEEFLINQAVRIEAMNEIAEITKTQIELDQELADLDKKTQKDKIEGIKKEKEMRQAAVSSMIGNSLALVSLFKDNSAEMFEMAKFLAIAQATMNTYQGVTKALADYGPILGPILAATTLALGLAQVSKIAATPYKARHGAIVGGFGNNTNDGETARVSRGERILSVEEVNALGGLSRIQDSIEAGVSKAQKAPSIVIQGNIIGEEEHVRRVIIPLITEEASRI